MLTMDQLTLNKIYKFLRILFIIYKISFENNLLIYVLLRSGNKNVIIIIMITL